MMKIILKYAQIIYTSYSCKRKKLNMNQKIIILLPPKKPRNKRETMNNTIIEQIKGQNL